MDKKIIYIAGYGRSGSTLLERILSSNAQISGLGELKYLLTRFDNDEAYCSCGEQVTNCDFWAPIITEIKSKYNISDLKELRLDFESVSRSWNHLVNKSGKKQYKKFTTDLLTTIFNNTAQDVKYIIDSSKTARDAFFRPFMLDDDWEVKVVHLVRDGRGCMWSNLKGSNRKMEQGVDPSLPFAALRTAVSWPLANCGGHLFQFFAPENYCRIKYENFVEQPNKILDKLGGFLDIDFSTQIDILINGEPIPLGHQLSGNRLRKKERIILNKDIEWREKLQLRYKLMFWLLDWPFALLYHYGKRGENK